MPTKSVFLLDDEFPKIKEFVADDIYSKAINADNLYHLALNENWKSLNYLQQLIKDIITSDEFKIGLINLSGYSDPELALQDIESGIMPDILIYDWQYGAEINHNNSQRWLLEILAKTDAFVFVYSLVEPSLPEFLNKEQFAKYLDRFQLFLKGRKTPQSFSSEEFIFQYIISAASKKSKIQIDGVRIEFTSNDYLSTASDILYLQRILGNKYVLDHLNDVDFSVDTSSVEKMLNDFNGVIYFNKEKGYLLSTENGLLQGKEIEGIEEITYLDVVKKFSLLCLVEVLERGILYI
jgi:hypothetical protein